MLDAKAVKCQEHLKCIESSASAPSLLACGGDLIVSVLQVQSRDSTEEPLISHVADLFIGARTQAMAWLPSARDDPDNTHIALAVAAADHRIRVFRDRDMAAVLDGHTDYITALAAAPAADHTTHAIEIASVADDRRCIVWELGATARKRVIPLAAAGVAVALGRGDVTIADKSGAVTTYSTQTAQAIRTATFGHPIRAASFGPDGMCVAVDADGSRWAIMRDGAVMATGSCEPRNMCTIRAGLGGAALGGPDARVQIIDAHGQDGAYALAQEGRVAALATCSGKWLAAGDGPALRLWPLAL